MKRTLKYLLRREAYHQTRKALRGLQEAGEGRQEDEPERPADVETDVSGGGSVNADDLERVLQSMDDYEFEHFVADLWERMGWETEVSTRSADRGIDVVATRRSPYEEKALIQAKRYGPNSTVGSPGIQQYASLKHQRRGVDKVLVVTTNGFSSQAEELAHQLNVKLIDVEDLVGLIEGLDARDLVAEYVPAIREPEPEPERGVDRSAPEASTGAGRGGSIGSGSVGSGSVERGRDAPDEAGAVRADTGDIDEADGRVTNHLPDQRWKWVAGATGAWALGIALAGTDLGVIALIAWIALPYTILKDGSWTRWRRWYAAAALLPVFAMFVGAWYLFMRWRTVGLESSGG